MDLLFDVLPAGHGVPHAGAGQPLHVLHNHEGLLLQSDDGQVVVIQLSIAERVETRPHRVLHSQAAVVQFAHLKGKTVKGKKSPTEGPNPDRAPTDKNNPQIFTGL